MSQQPNLNQNIIPSNTTGLPTQTFGQQGVMNSTPLIPNTVFVQGGQEIPLGALGLGQQQQIPGQGLGQQFIGQSYEIPTSFSQGLPIQGTNLGGLNSQQAGIGIPLNQGVPLNQGLPLNQGIPLNQGLQLNQGVPLNQGIPLNQGLQLNQGVPLNQGTPLNQGLLLNQGVGILPQGQFQEVQSQDQSKERTKDNKDEDKEKDQDDKDKNKEEKQDEKLDESKSQSQAQAQNQNITPNYYNMTNPALQGTNTGPQIPNAQATNATDNEVLSSKTSLLGPNGGFPHSYHGLKGTTNAGYSERPGYTIGDVESNPTTQSNLDSNGGGFFNGPARERRTEPYSLSNPGTYGIPHGQTIDTAGHLRPDVSLGKQAPIGQANNRGNTGYTEGYGTVSNAADQETTNQSSQA